MSQDIRFLELGSSRLAYAVAGAGPEPGQLLLAADQGDRPCRPDGQGQGGQRGRVARQVEQLAVLEPFSSAYGDDWWFRMVLAFAEIELHEYDRGLRNIEISLRAFGRNAHAAHIRAHLFYELGVDSKYVIQCARHQVPP